VNIAFKEWASVVEAIGQGRQILLLRKGGIAEGSGFQLLHREFLFFPTHEHQHARFLRPEFAHLVGGEEADVGIRLLARVAGVVPAPDIEMLRAAREHYIWNDDYLRQRYDYRPELPLQMILVRAWRLPGEHRIPNRPSYTGCKSWVNLTEEIPLEGAVPVLAESDFRALRDRLVPE